MTTLVLTVIGDDQSGLVDALSGVIADHDGNWDRSQMANLAGKFAGIVMVTVSEAKVDGLVAALEPLQADGLLDITVERVTAVVQTPAARSLTLELVGQDHPGIVHDIAHALASHGVSIEGLETTTESAPMAGGRLFRAAAVLLAPADVPIDELRRGLEELADELLVDIELSLD